jgi:hypothetical protein
VVEKVGGHVRGANVSPEIKKKVRRGSQSFDNSFGRNCLVLKTCYATVVVMSACRF